MKKLICVLCLFLLCACGPYNKRRFEIIKNDGSIEYVTANHVNIVKDGSLHLRIYENSNWVSIAIYSPNSYKSCVSTDD